MGYLLLEHYAFWIKNVGSTYQLARKTIFHHMLHKNMEDYVDDTLAKSKKRDTHLNDLEVILDQTISTKVKS